MSLRSGSGVRAVVAVVLAGLALGLLYDARTALTLAGSSSSARPRVAPTGRNQTGTTVRVKDASFFSAEDENRAHLDETSVENHTAVGTAGASGPGRPRGGAFPPRQYGTNDSSAVTSASASPHGYDLTVIVPGLGDPRRITILNSSLATMRTTFANYNRHMGDGEHTLRCIIYVWNSSMISEATTSLGDGMNCDVVFGEGKWVSHMLRAPPFDGSTTHVAVLIDDIDLSTNRVDVIHMMDRMQEFNFSMASAAAPNWTYAAMHPRKGCAAHRTDYADVLFAVFDVGAWRCWRSHLNLEINEYGWGYDVTFADLCNATVGIIDDALALHDTAKLGEANCKKRGGTCSRSYNRQVAMEQQRKWIANVENRLPPEAKCRTKYQYPNYLDVVKVLRPNCFDKCGSVKHDGPDCKPGFWCD